MIKYISLFIILLLCSCSTSYLVYNADVYMDDEKLGENVLVFDKQKENELFFYDSSKTGHFLMGNITVKNCTDTTIVKR